MPNLLDNLKATSIPPPLLAMPFCVADIATVTSKHMPEHEPSHSVVVLREGLGNMSRLCFRSALLCFSLLCFACLCFARNTARENIRSLAWLTSRVVFSHEVPIKREYFPRKRGPQATGQFNNCSIWYTAPIPTHLGEVGNV